MLDLSKSWSLSLHTNLSTFHCGSRLWLGFSWSKLKNLLLQRWTELQLGDLLVRATRLSQSLLPLATEAEDRVLLSFDHSLEGTCDLVLDKVGTTACSTLGMVFLLAVAEDLPASEAHLRVQLRDDWLRLRILQKDKHVHIILEVF